MSERPSDNLDDLHIDLARRIDEVCRRFEADWREGRRPPIEGYLGEVSLEGRPALRAELEALQRELRPSGETVARPDAAGLTAAEPQAAPSPSTVAEAPTIAPVNSPTSPIPGLARPSVHEEATRAPRDQATVDLGLSGPVQPDASSTGRIRYFGDYEIVREIARGGMGVVFQARQVSLNRPVALKMILAGQLADQTDVRRFYTEAEAAANLDHPGIVPIFEVGQHEGQHFFSMGFVEGQSLSQRLAEGPLPAREAAALMAKVAEAIECAHSRGVIHRDLKPGNILLDRSGNPRVTDFGLAKKLQGDSGLTGSGQIMGTPSYMPPEQAGGHRGEVGPPADVYALGATLYALITGRPPFQAATAMDTVLQVISDEPVPPRRLNATIPNDLETIVLKCLEKEPDKRYGSAADLAGELRRFLNGEPIVARPVGPAGRCWRWCRRNPALAAISGLAALALIVAAVVGISLAVVQTNAAKVERGLRGALSNTLAAVETERDVANSERIKAQGLASDLAMRRGRELALAREPGGLLWMTRALGLAPRTAEGSIRRNLDVLARETPSLEGVFPITERSTVAISPDRKVFLTADKDGVTRAWRMDDASPIGRPMPHGGPVWSVGFSPDGTKALVSGEDRFVRIWNIADGTPFGRPVRSPSPVNEVMLSPDGQTLVTPGRDEPPILWNAVTGVRIGDLAFPRSRFFAAAPCFSQDGKAVLAGVYLKDDGSKYAIATWIAADASFRGTRMEQASDVISAITFSPDGSLLLTSSIYGGAYLRKVADGSLVGQPMRHGGIVIIWGTAFSPDGKLVATCSGDKTARLWSTADASPIGRPILHDADVRAVAFSGDSKTLMTGSTDNTARLWDVNDGSPIGQPIRHQGAVWRVGFGPGDQTLLTGSTDQTARLWHRPGSSSVGSPMNQQRGVLAVAFSPDGHQIALGDDAGRVGFWNAADGSPSGDPVKPYAHAMKIEHRYSSIYSVTYRPDGKVLLTSAQDGTARLWSLPDGPQIGRSMTHKGYILKASFSPDLKTVLTSSFDKTARLWSARDGSPIGRPMPHGSPVSAAVFQPDGRALLTACHDGIVRLWDPADGSPMGEFKAHQGFIPRLLFSPDGQTFLTCGADGFVKLWKTSDHSSIGRPMPQQGLVRAAAFSPDGMRVVTAGDGGFARLWDARDGSPVGRVMAHQGPILGVNFAPDGQTVLTGSYDRTARLWDAADGFPIGRPWIHANEIRVVAYRPDGRVALTGGMEGIAQLHVVPRVLPGDPRRLALWSQVVTGTELDAEDSVTVHGPSRWRELKAELDKLGGPPRDR